MEVIGWSEHNLLFVCMHICMFALLLMPTVCWRLSSLRISVLRELSVSVGVGHPQVRWVIVESDLLGQCTQRWRYHNVRHVARISVTDSRMFQPPESVANCSEWWWRKVVSVKEWESHDLGPHDGCLTECPHRSITNVCTNQEIYLKKKSMSCLKKLLWKEQKKPDENKKTELNESVVSWLWSNAGKNQPNSTY